MGPICTCNTQEEKVIDDREEQICFLLDALRASASREKQWAEGEGVTLESMVK